jgi:two-component system chemotaxis response regulator CheB
VIRQIAGRAIRVLVIDDSALMRRMLTAIIAAEDDMEVVGAAADPLLAREMIKRLDPDVLTLDVEMPKLDGIGFLERLMTLRPMPVVMVSSLTEAGTATALRALELGAVDVVGKPRLNRAEAADQYRAELVPKLRAAAGARVRSAAQRVLAKPVSGGGYTASSTVIAIGASTGGVEAIRDVVTSMPADFPGVLITQHMPRSFTASFARRLDGIAAVRFAEAEDGARVLPGHVFIAPGERHLRLARAGGGYVCRLGDDGPISGHRPSVDALFASVAEVAGGSAIGAILTGMGRDGAEGLLLMRQAGAMTFGEDASTCVVYGMPKAAQAAGAVAVEVPLHDLVPQMMKRLRMTRGRGAEPPPWLFGGDA